MLYYKNKTKVTQKIDKSKNNKIGNLLYEDHSIYNATFLIVSRIFNANGDNL